MCVGKGKKPNYVNSKGRTLFLAFGTVPGTYYAPKDLLKGHNEEKGPTMGGAGGVLRGREY